MAKAAKSTSAVSGKLPEQTYVLDNGAYTLKAGFAQTAGIADDVTLEACEVIPNCIVRTKERKTYVAAQVDQISQWWEAVYRRPLENGQIVSWEAQKEIWDQSLFDATTASSKALISDPSDTVLLLTESPNNVPALQKSTDEIVMEEYGFGGYMRVVDSSLISYNDLNILFEGPTETEEHKSKPQSPRECLLVVDSGYSSTTITPCFQGRPIHRAVRRLDFGGKHLTNLLKETVSIRYQDLSQETKIVNDMKEDISFVSLDFKGDLEKTWKGSNRSQTSSISGEPCQDLRIEYVLPDGLNVHRGFSRPFDPSIEAARRRKAAAAHGDEAVMTLGNERFSIPEIIFNPADIGSKQPGLADCIAQSLAKLPPLVQATMVANTIVVGGNAKIPGFVERLESELRARVRSEWLVRVRKMPNSITSTWLGGARLATDHRSDLEKYAVTREQYMEYGSAWTARRFVGRI